MAFFPNLFSFETWFILSWSFLCPHYRVWRCNVFHVHVLTHSIIDVCFSLSDLWHCHMALGLWWRSSDLRGMLWKHSSFAVHFSSVHNCTWHFAARAAHIISISSCLPCFSFLFVFTDALSCLGVREQGLVCLGLFFACVHVTVSQEEAST